MTEGVLSMPVNDEPTPEMGSAPVVKKKARSRAKAKPKLSGMVKVRNYSKVSVNLKTGTLKPGEEGETTVAEANSYNKFIERV